MAKLTELFIKNLKVPAGKAEVFVFDDDIPGFFVRKLTSGTASVGIRYWANGRRRRKSLGLVRPGSLKEQRAAAQKLKAHAHLGEDPVAEARQRAAESRAAAAAAKNRRTFGELVQQYLDARDRGTWGRRLRSRSYVEVRRHLMEHFRSLHGRDIQDISRADLVSVLDVLAMSAPGAARRARAALSTFYQWAAEREFVPANPVLMISKAREIARERVLSECELAAIWCAAEPQAEDPKGANGYRLLVRLGILTALRRENLGALLWSEVDLENRELIIPASKMKNGREFRLPLSPQAAQILDAIEHRGAFVFGEKEGSGFSGWSHAKGRLDERIEPPVADWRLHDFRRTFASMMNEQGLAPPHVIDECLAHVGQHKAGVAGVYNRAKYTEEKRRAMDAWGQLVSEVVQDRADEGARCRLTPEAVA